MPRLEPGSLAWLTLHEIRLAYRSSRAGAKVKALRLLLLVGYTAFGIFIASQLADVPLHPAPRFLVYGSAGLAILLTFMMAQSLLGALRTLYTAGDLDLLLSSPLPEGRVVAAKLLGIAGTSALSFAVLLLPVVVPVALWGHPRLLAVVPMIGAVALVAASAGIGLAVALVRTIGARATKSVGQILAAILSGAIFLASQLAGRGASRGNRIAAVAGWMRRTGWGVDGWSAWPARGLAGEPLPLLACLAVAGLVFWGTARLVRTRFLASRQSAGDRSEPRRRRGERRSAAFSSGLTGAVVRKEVRLLLREPEILFMVLMRLVYLVPLVVIAWKGVGRGAGAQAPLLAGVGAVAAGQLCGSLSWLTLSAEDAPDLLAVAPVSRSAVRRRKLLAALLVALPFALIVPALLLPLDPAAAVASLIGAGVAGWAAGSIELRFGKPGHRASFARRRQGSFPASLLGGLAAMLIGALTALAAWFA